MADQQWSRAHVSASIALNLVSAISIVFLNKLLYVRHGFPSMTLTLLHFAITSLGLQICAWMDVFSDQTPCLISRSFLGAAVIAKASFVCSHGIVLELEFREDFETPRMKPSRGMRARAPRQGRLGETRCIQAQICKANASQPECNSAAVT